MHTKGHNTKEISKIINLPEVEIVQIINEYELQKKSEQTLFH